jgi:molecular chaperone GrpE (heat shock protein)
MTTRKHGTDHPDHGHKTPVEERLEARIAQQNQGRGAATDADPDPALAEARDRYLRLAADFENYKKRSRQEQLDTIQHASAQLISQLLPALDDLRNALDHKPAGVDPAWAKGVELGVRKLEEAMAAHGLEPIDSVGSAFDPKLHEAIGHEESAEHPEDTVVSELRRGYRMRDRVLRPSLVRVSRRPELPGAGSDASTES